MVFSVFCCKFQIKSFAIASKDREQKKGVYVYIYIYRKFRFRSGANGPDKFFHFGLNVLSVTITFSISS